MGEEVWNFLKESNEIEGVYDLDSFQQAELAWEYIVDKDQITVSDILKVHKILMLHHNIRPDQKGYFRKVPVWVGGREGANYVYLPTRIGQWIKQVNEFKLEPKETHVRFEKIHPFVDGNGRVGRILYNWYRLKKGLPIDIIKAAERQKYYEWFRDER